MYVSYSIIQPNFHQEAFTNLPLKSIASQIICATSLMETSSSSPTLRMMGSIS